MAALVCKLTFEWVTFGTFIDFPLFFLVKYRTKDHRAGPSLFLAHSDRREHLARSQNTTVGAIMIDAV